MIPEHSPGGDSANDESVGKSEPLKDFESEQNFINLEEEHVIAEDIPPLDFQGWIIYLNGSGAMANQNVFFIAFIIAEF